jgi:site-specific DNA-methyltransferase (adenine-specific)
MGLVMGNFCNKKVLPNKPFGLPTNFKDWVPEGTPGSVKCYVPKKHGFIKWVDNDKFTDLNGVLGKFNVFTASAGWGGNAYRGGPRTLISQIFIGDKLSICLETYIVTGSFNTKKEAENYMDYMKTKFFRFMLSLRVISQHINREKFSWVPDLGDYSHPYTDEDLYKKFNLTKREINHIEKSIKGAQQ